MRPCSGSRVIWEHVPKLLCGPSSGEQARHACVAVSGGGGDQHLTPGLVCKRETRLRAQEETGLEPAQRTKAEHQQELAGSADLQCVSAAQRCPFTKLTQSWAAVGVLSPRKRTDVGQDVHEGSGSVRFSNISQVFVFSYLLSGLRAASASFRAAVRSG